MSFIFTPQQKQSIALLRDAGDYVGAYNKVLEYISDVDAQGEQTPKVGVSGSVWLWFKAAVQINSNIGQMADAIRDYTALQGQVRNGVPFTEMQLNAASNAVANAVLGDIVDDSVLPDIAAIAQNDASQATEISLNVNRAAWSGNPFFLLLGHNASFTANLLETPGDTYDLLASMYCGQETGLGAVNTWGQGLYDIWQSISSNDIGLWATLGLVSSTMQQSSDFVGAAYSANLPLTAIASSNIILGRVTQDDVLSGTFQDDYIHGGGGNDTIYGSENDDILDGGEGKDVADFSAYLDSLIFEIDTKPSQAEYIGSASEGMLSLTESEMFNIEQITGTLQNDDFRIIHIHNNLTLDGGGSNSDRLSFEDFSQSVVVSLTGELVYVNGESMAVKNFEHVIGSMYNDGLTGNSAANTLEGGEGEDYLVGEAGNDSLDGGDEDDVLNGGGGINTLNGGAGNDLADLSSYDHAVSVNLANPTLSTDVLIDIESLVLTQYNDRGIGDGNDNRLSGIGGRDTLSGGAGKDTLVGGEGRDFLLGGDDADILDGDDQNDLFGGGDSDQMWGGKGADTLLGGQGNDYLRGEAGADLLEGGFGKDVLYAGNTGTGAVAGEVDVLYGGYDNDTLYGGLAAMSMYGGDGDDHLWIQHPGGTGPSGPGTTISGGTAGDALPGGGGTAGREGESKNDGDVGGKSGGEDGFNGFGTPTLLGGAGMDTYHLSIHDEVVIIDSDGKFTIDFTDETVLNLIDNAEYLLYFNTMTDIGPYEFIWGRDNPADPTQETYLLGFDAQNQNMVIHIMIKNIDALIDSTLVSIVDGNLQFGFPTENSAWGAENSSGFSYA